MATPLPSGVPASPNSYTLATWCEALWDATAAAMDAFVVNTGHMHPVGGKRWADLNDDTRAAFMHLSEPVMSSVHPLMVAAYLVDDL